MTPQQEIKALKEAVKLLYEALAEEREKRIALEKSAKGVKSFGGNKTTILQDFAADHPILAASIRALS